MKLSHLGEAPPRRVGLSACEGNEEGAELPAIYNLHLIVIEPVLGIVHSCMSAKPTCPPAPAHAFTSQTIIVEESN